MSDAILKSLTTSLISSNSVLNILSKTSADL